MPHLELVRSILKTLTTLISVEPPIQIQANAIDALAWQLNEEAIMRNYFQPTKKMFDNLRLEDEMANKNSLKKNTDNLYRVLFRHYDDLQLETKK